MSTFAQVAHLVSWYMIIIYLQSYQIAKRESLYYDEGVAEYYDAPSRQFLFNRSMKSKV